MEISNNDKKELVEVYKDASELNDFETPYVPTLAAPLKWSIEKYKVAELLAFSGKTRRAIAKELSLPVSVVESWCKNSEFMDAVNEMIMDSVKHMKKERLRVLNKILQARIEQAEQEGYADASRKDTVEIMEAIRKETGEDKSQDSNYTRLLERLVANPPVTQIINQYGGKDV